MTGRAALGALAAVVLLGLNLRTGVASLPPLLDDVRADLRLSGTAAGVLTALPVLAFGTFAPFVPRLVRRLAIERLLALCAAVTCAALALRGAGGRPRCTPGRCWPAPASRSRRRRCRSTSAQATPGAPAR